MYVDNPDNYVNKHGKKLLSWLKKHDDLCLYNGLRLPNNTFDSKCTFHRGTKQSQNDFVISNVSKNVKFKIHDSVIYSDHCPISIELVVSPSISLAMINACAKGIFRHDHYDINKRLLPAINSLRVDWTKALPLLINESKNLRDVIDVTFMSNNAFSTILSDTIYNICHKCYKPKNLKPSISPTDFPNCTSKNYKAIAEMNLFTYQTQIDNGFHDCRGYLNSWSEFELLARQAEDEEYNTKINTGWKSAKNDGRKLWNMIDWKGKANTQQSVAVEIGEEVIQSYFRSIFQSSDTKHHPAMSTIQQDLQEYVAYVPTLDNDIEREELTIAIKDVGKGVGIDGLTEEVIRMMRPDTVDLILSLMKNVFSGAYPKEWEKQILHALPKPGHLPVSPALRGISVAIIMARLYDSILQGRFRTWYTPNREQAGFCEKQGCSLQTFALFLLIDYTHSVGKDLYVGFMDYAKAFDYANRASIIKDLMSKGCGKKFTEAIAKMFHSTSYIPKVGNKLGDEIITQVGVAQGRKSSPDMS